MDKSQDSDSDLLANLDEYRMGTKPNVLDTDNDGLIDGHEAIAGTSATNSADRFKVNDVTAPASTNAIVIQWNTVTGRLYTVHSMTNLMSSWTNVYQIPGDGGQKAYTNTDPTAGRRFFRLGVELESP